MQNVDGGLLDPTDFHAVITVRKIMLISLVCVLESSGWFSLSALRETKTEEVQGWGFLCWNDLFIPCTIVGQMQTVVHRFVQLHGVEVRVLIYLTLLIF